MRRELLHIYGPFSINSYGLALLIGVLLALILMLAHPKRKSLISEDALIRLIVLSILVGIGGARLLFVLSGYESFESFWDIFKLWEGGLSMLGGVVSLIVFLPLYMRHLKVPMLPLLDLVAVYVPLVEAFGRIGCFLAGCCYGLPTQLPWGITYTNPNTVAPMNICLHPTQLYTSLLFFCIFFLMRYVFEQRIQKPGQLFMLYLMFVSFVRFTVDFLRGDQEFFDPISWCPCISPTFLAIHQWVALAIFSGALIGFILLNRRSRTVS
jgi:phosphatidylglycerol:prolipoprotein diacylglycerol transferase